MSDSELWFPRLEKLAFIQLSIAILGCIGASQQSYNVAVGVYTLFNVYTRVGRINASCGVFYLISFLADIIVLSVHGDSWASLHGVYSFSMAMIIINIFVKAVGLLMIILIYGELGYSMHTLQYNSSYPYNYSSNPDNKYSGVGNEDLTDEDIVEGGKRVKNNEFTGSYQGQTSL